MEKLREKSCSEFMIKFRDSFFEGNINQYTKTSYISVFDGWLSRADYDSKIKNASREFINKYNNLRYQIFYTLFKDCAYLNVEDKQYYDITSEDDFYLYFLPRLNELDDFLIVSKTSSFAIQSGYDFTDSLYYTDVESKKYVNSIIAKFGMFVFD
ncbi:TPA: hypothetical protein L3M66_003896 [Vibrio parahaemolyticus]|uniref:hypothetical protein n=1 Tax=Vibrio parahaemolyticus TaxID=670 RepID=UPI00111E2A57|nr:hypothetical protein [Vibrio parahaemolyticus]TOB16551.1 hypothetical protein CGK10_18570 [Vibrio parahaemolyticus]HBN6205262.1 hypothetical protein [Vibrio parahaemolyticus]